MRIKKTSATTSLPAQVVNTYNESDSDTYSCDYINGINTYSTDEVDTGKKWINNKPIYKKVIEFTSISANNTQYKSFGVNNIDTIIGMNGILKDSTTFRDINTTNNIIIFVNINNNNIYMVNNSSDAFTNAYIIVEYTKTTDTSSNTRNLQESKKSVSEEEVKEPIEEPIENELKDENR